MSETRSRKLTRLARRVQRAARPHPARVGWTLVRWLLAAGLAGMGAPGNSSQAYAASDGIDGSIVMRIDFETGNWSQFDGMECPNLSRQFRAVTSPVRQGRYAGRFEEGPGDIWPGNNTIRCLGNKTQGIRETNGDEYYYGLSVFIPDGGVSSNLIWEIHNPGAIYSVYTCIAPLALHIQDGGFRFRLATGECRSPGTRYWEPNIPIPGLTPYPTNTWIDFIFHIRYREDYTGLVEIWHRTGNGAWTATPQLARYNVPTTQYISSPSVHNVKNYTEMGLYKGGPTTSQTDVIYLDGYRVGTSFNAVRAEFPAPQPTSAPAPAPTPAPTPQPPIPTPVPSPAPAPVPTITQSIQPGQTLVGIVPWTVTPSAAVKQIEFYRSGEKLATLTSPPYTYQFDTTKLANGAHTLGLTVTLLDGRIVWEPYQIGTVTVNNPPAPLPPPGAPPSGSPSWVGDFETGNTSQYSYGDANPGGAGGYQCKTSDGSRGRVVSQSAGYPVRLGNYSSRQHIEPGDTNVAGSNQGERCDILRGGIGAEEGSEMWYAWSLYLPSDYNPTPGTLWNNLANFHKSGGGWPGVNLGFDYSPSDINSAAQDTVPEKPRPSTIVLQMFGGPDLNNINQELYNVIPNPQRNVWYDFLVHVKWAAGGNKGYRFQPGPVANPNSTGFIEVWINGQQFNPANWSNGPVSGRHYRPMLFVNDTAYLKLANYRGGGGPASTLFYDEARAGLTRASVALAPAPTPAPAPQPPIPTPVPSPAPAPVPTITQSIQPGQTLVGIVPWTVTPSAAVKQIEFYRSGEKLATLTSPPYTYQFDTTKLANGAHTLGLTVTLLDGRIVWEPYQIGTVTVDNPTPAPPPAPTPTPVPPPASPPDILITQTNIQAGATVPPTTTWSVQFNQPIEHVEFWADGVQLGDDATAPYDQLLALAPGSHAINVCAWVGTTRDCDMPSPGGVWAWITVIEPAPPAPAPAPAPTPTPPPSFSGNIVPYATYETSDLSEFKDSTCHPERVAINSSGARQGTRWARFSANETTQCYGDTKNVRVHMLGWPKGVDFNINRGATFWWAFSLRIPSSSSGDYFYAGPEIHQAGRSLEGKVCPGSAPFNMGVSNNRWRFIIRGYPDCSNSQFIQYTFGGPPGTGYQQYWAPWANGVSDGIQRDQWYDFLVGWHMATDNTGWFEAWVNGPGTGGKSTQVIPRTNIPTAYNADNYPLLSLYYPVRTGNTAMDYDGGAFSTDFNALRSWQNAFTNSWNVTPPPPQPTPAPAPAPTPPPPTITQNIKAGDTLPINFTWTATPSATLKELRFHADGTGIPLKVFKDTQANQAYSFANDATILKPGPHTLGLTVIRLDGTEVWQPYQIGPVTVLAPVPALPTSPVNTALPTVSGTAQVGQTLTASSGTWTGTEPIAYSYRWQRCGAAGANCTAIAGATGTAYTLAAADAGKTIRISVTATNTVGSVTAVSAASAGVLEPPDTSAPTVPTGLAAEAPKPTTVKLAWKASADNVGVTAYQLYRTVGCQGDQPCVAEPPEIGAPCRPGDACPERVRPLEPLAKVTELTYVDSTVTADTTYYYAVSALDAAGNESAKSGPVTVRTPKVKDTEAPSAPSQLKAEALDATTVKLTWQPATDNVGVTVYYIFRDGTKLVELAAVATTYTDTTALADRRYTYALSALDADGNESGKSQPVTVTTPKTPDKEAPTTPQDVKAEALSATEVRLTWTAATDNVAVTGYRLYRDSALASTVMGTSYIDSGLSEASTYVYRISALDAAGNESARSQAVSVTTPKIEPPPTEPPPIEPPMYTPGRLTIATSILTDATSAAFYYAPLAAAGGATPYRNWRVADGVLPEGLVLNPTTGVIAGRIRLEVEESTPVEFTIQVTDAAGALDERRLKILINPADYPSCLLSGPDRVSVNERFDVVWTHSEPIRTIASLGWKGPQGEAAVSCDDTQALPDCSTSVRRGHALARGAVSASLERHWPSTGLWLDRAEPAQLVFEVANGTGTARCAITIIGVEQR